MNGKRIFKSLLGILILAVGIILYHKSIYISICFTLVAILLFFEVPRAYNVVYIISILSLLALGIYHIIDMDVQIDYIKNMEFLDDWGLGNNKKDIKSSKDDQDSTDEKDSTEEKDEPDEKIVLGKTVTDEDLAKWINYNAKKINGNSGYKIPEKEIEKIKNEVDKAKFKKVISNQILGKIYPGNKEKMENTPLAHAYAKVYNSVFGNDKFVGSIVNYSQTYIAANTKVRNIEDKYPVEIEKIKKVGSSEYYINNQIEVKKQNNDNDNEAYWYASNVERGYFGATPGESECAIVTDKDNPFPKSGSYYVDYYSIGTDFEVTDNKGFVRKIPLIYQVDNVSDMEKDIKTWQEEKNKCIAAYNNIVSAVTGKNQTVVEKIKLWNIDKISSHSSDDYILPDVDRKYITNEQLDKLYKGGMDEVQYAINEVYAKHGYDFKTKEIKDQFLKKSWYKPNPNLTDQNIKDSLNEYERNNLEKLFELRNRLKNN